MIRLGRTTPWVRDYLRTYPEEAMEAETLRRMTPVEGTLVLSGAKGAKSWRGPFQAAIYTERTYADGLVDGYRANGSTILLALEAVLAVAEPAEADEVTA